MLPAPGLPLSCSYIIKIPTQLPEDSTEPKNPYLGVISEQGHALFAQMSKEQAME